MYRSKRAMQAHHGWNWLPSPRNVNTTKPVERPSHASVIRRTAFRHQPIQNYTLAWAVALPLLSAPRGRAIMPLVGGSGKRLMRLLALPMPSVHSQSDAKPPSDVGCGSEIPQELPCARTMLLQVNCPIDERRYGAGLQAVQISSGTHPRIPDPRVY